MSATGNPEHKAAPEIGKPVQTACGGWVIYSPDTPSALYRGEVIYFCTPSCKADFDRSPETSCLAWRILLERR